MSDRTTVDRMNTLVRQSTETAFETIAVMQRQNAELFHNWLTTFEASQQSARELALQSIKQAQEAQGLWIEFVQEAFDAGVDNVTTVAQNGLKESSEQVAKAARQGKAEAASK